MLSSDMIIKVFNTRQIDTEVDELIEKIKEIYPIKEDNNSTTQDSRGSLLIEIVEFVRRNHK